MIFIFLFNHLFNPYFIYLMMSYYNKLNRNTSFSTSVKCSVLSLTLRLGLDQKLAKGRFLNDLGNKNRKP